MDTILTIVLEAAFFAVFGAVLLRYVRRPSPLNRDVLLVFGAVAGLFLLTVINQVIDGPAWLGTVASVLLIAQPFLAVRLIRHFTPLPVAVQLVVLAAFLVAVGFVVNGIAGNRAALLFVVGYFVLVNVGAGLAFLVAGRARVGTARTRLAVAGLASFLFGGSILIAGAGSAAAAPGAGSDPSVAMLARAVALLAGVLYLAAFAPPRWLRRIQQQAIAFELNHDLLAFPEGTEPPMLWRRLAAAARRVTGARAAAIVGSGPAAPLIAEDGEWRERPAVGAALGRSSGEAPLSSPAFTATPPEPLAGLAAAAGASSTIRVPLGGIDGSRGELSVFIAGTPLFVDDDLDLLSVLASRTLVAIEREEALADRSALVTTLRQTNEELARASAAKSDFLAAMSHELRTPLNSIIGFSELLMAPLQAEREVRGLDVVDRAGHIHAAGLQLLDLINEVLDLARVEAGRLELAYQVFDLVALVRRTVDSMGPLADRASVRLEVEAGEELVVEADPGRVRQIVYNLLSNAIKFSPAGGTVRVAVAETDGLAAIDVTDEGPGVPADERAVVFEAFAQGARGRGRGEGAGLGLALSRQLAEAHGGTIELAPPSGTGSMFTLRLPVRRPAGGGRRGDRSHRKLVLIVEDDPGSVALMRSWLEPEGYAIVAAPTGEEGLRLARELAPDAILLDIMLPGRSGWDVLQELRLDRRTRPIPILVISVVDDQQLGLALGAADYLVKPVDRDHLVDRLRSATRRRTGGSDGQLVVLAIDADEADQASYRRSLDGAARIVEARTGADARRLAAETTPDAILLDLALPDESPFAVLADLKGHPATREVPVVALARHPLSEADKERLNGQVVAVLQDGEAARGLVAWLGSVHDGGGDAAIDGAVASPTAAAPGPERAHRDTERE